jgi:hypothetical protein
MESLAVLASLKLIRYTLLYLTNKSIKKGLRRQDSIKEYSEGEKGNNNQSMANGFQ